MATPHFPKPARIVVVDSSPQVQAAVKRLFEKARHEVTSFEVCLPALQFMRTSPFDLLIVDAAPDDVDCETFLTAAKSRCPEADIVVIGKGQTIVR